MNSLAWLLSLIMPACGAVGEGGLPVPPPMDMAALMRPGTPNTALAAPPGFTPAPDVVTTPYDMPPERLYAAIRAVAEAAPRSFPAARYDERRQAHYVVRSALLNYPDLVTVAVSGPPEGPATLVIYARSVYGRSDFGVNRQRVEAWLTALAAAGR